MKKIINIKFLLIVLLFGGVFFIISGFWIPVKALLAQALLQHAWQESITQYKQQKENIRVRPWPWADSWPIGRIKVKRLGVNLIILEGNSGESLAFGPGHEECSGLPGKLEHIILYGHRDTSFSFLADLKKGDLITIEGLETQQKYEVENMEVVDSSKLFLKKNGNGFISLITCYPFFQPIPGSTLRYLVTGRIRGIL